MTDKKKKKSSEKEPKVDELQLLEERIAELENEVETLEDKNLRLTAEFDNYRKRTLKEKMELTKHAGEKILTNILPVIDNFERAMDVMQDTKDIEAVKEGIELIYSNFKDFLRQNGVTEIEVLNEEFDTDVSEAITKIPAPSEDMKGKVIDCTEKGYKLNDKVIRYAKVVVGE
ncbi:molecular chaperone GrpE [Balneicella halophila]|uniref:Protein GrpE n=1 Tax=Balneicella halophila TaxID=1537566 RepID=A0A7L4UN39_BALHA|nr:nucleotide exchange factor GrpE [Balneicella halophila]PVX49976.1 molecular chaperone GrpE [Balneicella halophila]